MACRIHRIPLRTGWREYQGFRWRQWEDVCSPGDKGKMHPSKRGVRLRVKGASLTTDSPGIRWKSHRHSPNSKPNVQNSSVSQQAPTTTKEANKHPSLCWCATALPPLPAKTATMRKGWQSNKCMRLIRLHFVTWVRPSPNEWNSTRSLSTRGKL